MAQAAKQDTGRELVQRFTGMLDQGREKIARSLPATVDVDRFIDVAQTAVMRNAEEMRKCSMESLILAVKQCAQAGLLPDGQESAIVRYGSEATWMPMVQGIVRLMLRSPDVAKVEARVVRRGDIFDYHYGLRPTLDHRPLHQSDRGSAGAFGADITAAYAIVFWKDLPPEHATFEVVTREDIERARNTSRASNSPAWRDWYGEMARKVALHRIKKYVDLAPEAQRVIESDISAGWETDPPMPTGLSLEEKLAVKAQQDTDAIRRRLSLQAGEPEAFGPEPASEGESEAEPGPAEPSEEEIATAEAKKTDNYLLILGALVGDDGPLEPEDLRDAAEKLFGGREGIQRTAAGFVDVGVLGMADLKTLHEELAEMAEGV